ncbi:50S ribosome-binding GTPase [Ceratobasidium sp. AG-Ba]|nr:50S ribosome-binding GTPase [Ceratobasidium sp. AG-Ba]
MPPALIVVFGPAGAGKTSFINCVTGSKLPIGHTIQSCTKEVTTEGIPVIEIDGVPVQLVDTPAFDDLDMSDRDVFQAVSDFLDKFYHEGQLITGLVYVHRITDVRLSGSSKRSLRMLHELCDDDSLKRILFLTTMWSSPVTQRQLDTQTELQEHPIISRFGAWSQVLTQTPSEGRSILKSYLNSGTQSSGVQKKMVKKVMSPGAASALQIPGEARAEFLRRNEQEVAQIRRAFVEAEAKRREEEVDGKMRQADLYLQRAREAEGLSRALKKEQEEREIAAEEQSQQSTLADERREATEAQLAQILEYKRREEEQRKLMEQQLAILHRQAEIIKIKEQHRKKGSGVLKLAGAVAVAGLLL